MDRRHVLALSSALLSGAIAGCLDRAPAASPTDDEGDPDDGTDDPDENGAPDDEPGIDPDLDDETLSALVAATNGFAMDLFDRLRDDDETANLFVSPISISIALAMTYAGARGRTREEMGDVLRFGADDRLADDALHEAFATIQAELNERSDIDPDDLGDHYDEDDEPVPFELNVVNAVWGLEEYPFEASYLDLLETYYGGGLREVDFVSDPDGSRQRINEWVADETNDRIDELLPEGSIDDLTRLVLTNAVYFLANWAMPFEEANTDDGEFTAIDGTTHTVAMMRHGEEQLPYADVDGTQALELPYVGNEVSMLLILPPEGEFEEYEATFDDGTIGEILDALEPREGSVELPRFEFDSGVGLGDVLEAMGMVDAFDPNEADFSGMADLEAAGENLFVDGVYHDTYVAVDEEGTEAAAATGVVVRAESAPLDPFEFVADRPFLFAIRDRPTDTLLFVGRAVDPAGWEE